MCLNNKEENGFDESELWSLDMTIARFIHPRLTMFYDNLHSHPVGMSFDEWKNIVETMVNAFELLSNNELFNDYSEEQEVVIEKGLDNFRKYYRCLWN